MKSSLFLQCRKAITTFLRAALGCGMASFVLAQDCKNYLTFSNGMVQESALVEISGIAVSRQNPGVIWAHNDRSETESARVFAMSSSGTHLGVYNLENAIHTDFEDITIGPGPLGQDYLYIGDVGDNDFATSNSRATITIYRFPEPSVDPSQSPVTQNLSNFEEIVLTYPNAPSTVYDCETIMSDPVTGDLYLVTKDRIGNGANTRVFVYHATAENPSTVLVEVANLNLSAQITGGDISPTGAQMILRPKSDSGLNAMLWHWPNDASLAEVFGFDPCNAPVANEPQGEAIAFAHDELSYFTISEGSYQTIYQYEEQGPISEGVANGEVAVRGVRSGTFTDTYSDDDLYEAITEVRSGGKPSNRYSTLEHQWTFSVPAGDVIEFHLQGYHSANDEDDYDFHYSTDGTNFSDLLLTVDKESDDDITQIATLPGTVSGDVWVRVTDTDRGAGNLAMGTIFIDEMFFRSIVLEDGPPGQAFGPSPEDAATNVPITGTILSWNAGTGATTHRLYFGTDPDNLTQQPDQTSTTFDPGDLDATTTYYWRVDEINDFDGTSTTPGERWSFETGDGPPPPASITLSASGFKEKGKHVINLSWSGTTKNVDIYREGDSTPFAMNVSEGSYTVETGRKGSATYVFQVCESDPTAVCSDVVSVTF